MLFGIDVPYDDRMLSPETTLCGGGPLGAGSGAQMHCWESQEQEPGRPSVAAGCAYSAREIERKVRAKDEPKLLCAVRYVLRAHIYDVLER